MDITSVAGKKVITYATKELSDFLSKIDDVVKTKMGFSPFVDEADHLIPKLFKGPEVFTNLMAPLKTHENGFLEYRKFP